MGQNGGLNNIYKHSLTRKILFGKLYKGSIKLQLFWNETMASWRVTIYESWYYEIYSSGLGIIVNERTTLTTIPLCYNTMTKQVC